MPANKSPQTPILSVSELNQFARGTLEMHVGQIWVSGEVSNFSQPASGHWYFTLKDDNAQIRCAMFKGKNQFIRSNIHSGMQVLVNGKVSLYEGRGDYQLIADYLEESGIGSMARAFEVLKAKLNTEGLFDQSHKQALPSQLKHIAVITSETGAAIHDILSVLKERFPALKVTLIPATVQGDNAPTDLINGLKQAFRYNRESPIDAVIIGRGGGSAEDLWAFNNERLARAVYAFPLPIISAVGHEVDLSICDLVADVRAPTPSAAAEMISPDQDQVRQQLDHICQRLERSINNKLMVTQQQLALLKQGLQHPQEKIKYFQQAFKEQQQKLNKSILLQVQLKQFHLTQAQQALFVQAPLNNIKKNKSDLTSSSLLLNKAMQNHLENNVKELSRLVNSLNIINPLATLSRGYSISKDSSGTVIHSHQQIKAGDTITTLIEYGKFSATVTKTEPTH